MEEVEAKLKRFQKEIIDAGTQESKLIGEKESILKRLKGEYKLGSSDEARTFVDVEKEKKQKLNEELNDKLQQIERDYGFG